LLGDDVQLVESGFGPTQLTMDISPIPSLHQIRDIMCDAQRRTQIDFSRALKRPHEVLQRLEPGFAARLDRNMAERTADSLGCLC